MIDTVYAIETAEETDRQYLAGSPVYLPRQWDGGETAQRFRLARKVRADSAAQAVTMKFTDLAQQVYSVTFRTRRTYVSPRVALLAAFRQGGAHRWGGTAVMLVRKHGANNEWYVYRAPKAVLSGRWYVQGCSLFIDYEFRLGAWTVEATTEIFSGVSIMDEDQFPILDEEGFPILS
jgi:hypothetical protein